MKKRKASLSFIITILVVGYAFFTVVYLFLFIAVCIQYETGSADQQ